MINSGNPYSQSIGANAGGVIGKMQNYTLLQKSYFNGQISGREAVGGIVGKSTYSSVLYTIRIALEKFKGNLLLVVWGQRWLLRLFFELHQIALHLQ